jgi:hypothetical protein
MAFLTAPFLRPVVVALILSCCCLASGFAWSSKLDSSQISLSDAHIAHRGELDLIEGDEVSEDELDQSSDVENDKPVHEPNENLIESSLSKSIAMESELSQSGPLLDDLYKIY